MIIAQVGAPFLVLIYVITIALVLAVIHVRPDAMCHVQRMVVCHYVALNVRQHANLIVRPHVVQYALDVLQRVSIHVKQAV